MPNTTGFGGWLRGKHTVGSIRILSGIFSLRCFLRIVLQPWMLYVGISLVLQRVVFLTTKEVVLEM